MTALVHFLLPLPSKTDIYLYIYIYIYRVHLTMRVVGYAANMKL